MPADNRHHLAAAAARRSATTYEKAAQTLRRLDATGSPVTFAAVAAQAGVSRAWLYRHPDIRTEIERLRSTTRNGAPPAAQRASDASLHERIKTLLADNRALRRENRRLQEQVEMLLGRQRADNTPPRSITPIGPCS